MTQNNLSKEYEFYKKNKPQLQEKYNNQYIALKNCKVITSGNNKKIVIDEMIKKGYSVGDFLTHLVSDDSDIVQRYYSRVY
jgi:hypothetical protein